MVLQELDFEALEHATVYEDGFTAESPTVRYFWDVVHSFTEVRRTRVRRRYSNH